MAIDDNSWDAGYECGLRDQKKADAAQILELNQQIGMLQALLASRCKAARDEVSEKIRKGARMTDHRISL